MTKPAAGSASSDKKGYSTREDAPSYQGGVSFGKDADYGRTEPSDPSDQVSKEAEKVADEPIDPAREEKGELDEDSPRNEATAADDERNAEELIDAVLEADAAAMTDEAMDEERTKAQAEAASKELEEWKGKYMRLHAEWDTYRRRQKEQAETQKALAAEKLVSNLIPVIDDLERSIDYASKNGETGLLSGVEAVLAKFVDTLEKDGVVVIDPKGEAFEALEAQAVGVVDDPSQPDETVADVYQKGYKIGSKVLRPAMVTITQGGPKRPKDEEREEE